MADADLVLVGADVLTVDDAGSTAQAVAIRDGVIVAVGSDADAREFAGPRTRVVDLAGRTVLPGLNDSHLHACAFGMMQPPFMVDIGFPAVHSIADIVTAIGEAATTAAPGEWVMGKGWDTGYLEECRVDSRRLPTRDELDAVSGDHPVWLQDYSGHMMWVNTRVLDLAGIDANTPSPPGGVIVRDNRGVPTGILQEGAQDLIESVLPPISMARREAAIRNAISIMNAEGITSFTEPGLGPGGGSLFGGASAAATLEAYANLARRGELTARVAALLLPCGQSGSSLDLARGLQEMSVPDDVDRQWLSVIGVKIFGDGIPPNKTAWMYNEYPGGGGCGSLCVSGETDDEKVAEVTEMIRLAHAAGYQVGVHVTGDRATDTVVDGFLAAQGKHPRDDPRHYVIHGDFTSPETLAAMARGGIGLNTNPAIKWTIADVMEEMFGAERAAYQWPIRTAMESGVALSSSSDAPVTFPDWRRAVSVMMLRQSKASGRTHGPEQRVGISEAIRAYTATPAKQDFAETWKGSIEVGKVADLAVIDGPLRQLPAAEIPDTPVVMTVAGGRVVHDVLP